MATVRSGGLGIEGYSWASFGARGFCGNEMGSGLFIQIDDRVEAGSARSQSNQKRGVERDCRVSRGNSWHNDLRVWHHIKNKYIYVLLFGA